MKKIIFLMIIGFMVVSCDKTESPIYNQNQTLVYFAENDERLDVILDEGGQVEVEVGASTLSDQDRTVEVEFLGSSFDENENENFDFDNTAIIPAGEYSGTFTVTGFEGNITTDPEILEFGLVSVDAENTVVSGENIEVSMRLVCPIPEDFLVGEYFIEDVSGAIGPSNGTENFASGLITIESGPGSTQRNFDVGILPAFAGDRNVVLDLACGLFKLGDVDPNLTCDEENTYLFVAASNEVATTYDIEGSDEQFTITYTEDPQGSCGGPFQSSFRITKQN
ncbi:MAG: hypothetical protein ABR595_02035 [Psychroflexus sp.]